jgi:hypothetical protein
LLLLEAEAAAMMAPAAVVLVDLEPPLDYQ